VLEEYEEVHALVYNLESEERRAAV
jgi:hypothetical protein